MLVVDLSASFYSGRTFSDYQERLPGQASYLTDIHTDIKDRNQACRRGRLCQALAKLAIYRRSFLYG